jgi:hypothetical protein
MICMACVGHTDDEFVSTAFRAATALAPARHQLVHASIDVNPVAESFV